MAIYYMAWKREKRIIHNKTGITDLIPDRIIY